MGLAGVSIQIIMVSGRSAASTAARSLVSTGVTLTPCSANAPRANSAVPG